MLSIVQQPRLPKKRSWWRSDRPRVIAMFSFRYDSHLVPALLENIAPMVDGWVCWDDRGSSDPVSIERDLRFRLLEAAHGCGADWVLRVDPDERFEAGLATRMDSLTAHKRPIVWTFNLRDLYSPDEYRVDGIWGLKQQGRLFPLFDSLFPVASNDRFSKAPFHGELFPAGYRRKKTGLNLYHLKMIDPIRRKRRRDLYVALDPDHELQEMGYDYLADETGAQFTAIPPNRRYHPPHVEDHGLWMAELSGSECDRS